MTSHRWQDRLSDYLDGELDAAGQEEMTAHLGECADCAQLLEELRSLVGRAGALADRAPEHELWAGIEARLPARAQPGGHLLRHAAAAALFMLIGGLASWLLFHDGTERSSPPASRSVYMLILHEPAGLLKPMTPARRRELVQEYTAWAGQLAGDGLLVDGRKLGEEAGWILRPGSRREAMRPLDDVGGVAGYFLVHADTYAEALTTAESCPHLGYGGWIEIRRIDEG